MQNISPGVYADGETLHIVVPEMLRHYGWEDTEENRETMAQTAADAVKAAFPESNFAAIEIKELRRDE